MSPGLCAAGCAIQYLQETQKTTLAHISSVSRRATSDFVQIDHNSWRSLDIDRTLRSGSREGTLLHALDRTVHPHGARKLRHWLREPLIAVDEITHRQQAISCLIDDGLVRTRIRQRLRSLADVERIAARIALRRCTPRDLSGLSRALDALPAIADDLRMDPESLLGNLASQLCGLTECAELLQRAMRDDPPTTVREGGFIAAGYSAELDRLRAIGSDGQQWLADYQSKEGERTGITHLKCGFNRVFGYYIEIPNSARDQAPPEYVRKQTIKNAERYITDELKEYETQALSAEEKALELEQQLFDQLRRQAAQYISRLQALAETVAQSDCLAALAYLAKRRNYIRPRLSDGGELIIHEGKHPVLAETLGSEFVPNDVALGNKSGDILVITGPNMSGKSTYIRQVALLVLMAQTGSFIPAREAEIGLVDKIFTRVGASDELIRGQSTFMVEMTETANIINNATYKSLVILDEVGRGTSTYDGLSLAWAITEYIANKLKCRTFFATHYHELTELSELFENVKNCNVAVREWMDEVVFLHKILPGGTDKSYGIHVAKLAGVPGTILDRSKEILEELESTFQKEATGEHLSRHKTKEPDKDSLFVQKHKSILDKLTSTDVNNLTPIEAINLLNEIKNEINEK